MTFLYDIGRVLLDFDFESSLARLLPADCPNPEERLRNLLEKKDALEAGSIDADDYVNWALGVLGSEATPEEFRHAWQRIFTPNDAMWQNVRTLSAAGHRLILFSNINAIHCPWMFEAYPQFSLFDGAVLSFKVGSIKPHPPIYQHAVDAHDLDPATTLYIDDMAENVATGREFGFHCHRYDLKNHSAFEQWLSSFQI